VDAADNWAARRSPERRRPEPVDAALSQCLQSRAGVVTRGNTSGRSVQKLHVPERSSGGATKVSKHNDSARGSSGETLWTLEEQYFASEMRGCRAARVLESLHAGDASQSSGAPAPAGNSGASVHCMRPDGRAPCPCSRSLRPVQPRSPANSTFRAAISRQLPVIPGWLQVC